MDKTYVFTEAEDCKAEDFSRKNLGKTENPWYQINPSLDAAWLVTLGL
jgi:hypothetical protein